MKRNVAQKKRSRCSGWRWICCLCFFLIFSFALVLFNPLVILLAGGKKEYINKDIGDILSNSSALTAIDTSVSSVELSFSSDDVSVYTTSNEPPVIIDILPLKYISAYEGDTHYNYLGDDEPIYLLPGSKLLYNTTITSTSTGNGRLDSSPTCVYLSKASVEVHHEVNSHCFFMAAFVIESWSFNITEEAQYYVTIDVQENVTVDSNVSVVRGYYNTTGLEKVNDCSNSNSCVITTCGIICDRSDIYIVVETSMDKVSAAYKLQKSSIYGVSIGVFFVMNTLPIWFVFPCILCMYLYCRICCKQHWQHQLINIRRDNESEDRQRLQRTDSNCTDTEPFSDSSLSLVECRSFKQTRFNCLRSSHGIEQDICIDSRSHANGDVHLDLSSLIPRVEGIFGDDLTVLDVDNSGLIHHCSWYGVTLIIPEGAVPQPATVWFGARLFSDRFQFEGYHVPVSPIVWVYVDQELLKPAELHIPHHIDLSGMSDAGIKEQLFLLTAADDKFLSSKFMLFKRNYQLQVEIEQESQVAKIAFYHFCSNCIATHRRKYKALPKKYLIARADKKDESKGDVHVDFILMYLQQGCKQMVEGQCAKEGFRIIEFRPVVFTDDGRVSLSFDLPNTSGWIRTSDGFCTDYISKEEIDYYEVMGCEGGEVTQEDLDQLDMLEDMLSYPPRFRMKFTVDNEAVQCSNRAVKVEVKFNGVRPLITNTISLERPGVLPISPRSSLSSLTGPISAIDMFCEATDPDLGHMLRIIAKAGHRLEDEWFAFGYKLGLTTGQLNEIELSCSVQSCTRKVLLHWRVTNNMPKSWEALAKVLAELGLSNSAHKLRDCLSRPAEPEALLVDEPAGVYCSLCDEFHLTPESIGASTLSTAPSIKKLNELVGAKIEDKYHLFGVAIGLEESYLQGLRIDYPTCKERFNQIFNKWKESDPDSFTWNTVIEVLQSNTVDAREVAELVLKFLK